eukprot:5851908-Prymnesium_polylepis.1
MCRPVLKGHRAFLRVRRLRNNNCCELRAVNADRVVACALAARSCSKRDCLAMVWKYIPGCLGIANVVVQTVMLLTQTPNHFPGWRLDAAGGRAAFTLATLGASVILTSV